MKICIYDSGIGGRSVYRLLEQYIEEHELSAQFQLHYFGDEENFPYGTKTEDELRQIIFKNIKRFQDEGFDCIAVACNTASAVVERHWEELNGPESIRTIVRPTVDIVNRNPEQYPSLYVIASEFTANNHIYQRAINRVQPGIKIVEVAAQQLINHIEVGDVKQYTLEVENSIKSVQDNATLLLGCTHFSYIDALFYDLMQKHQKQFQIIDPAKEMAKAVEKWMIGKVVE